MIQDGAQVQGEWSGVKSPVPVPVPAQDESCLCSAGQAEASGDSCA
jgi:hypothetical protein